MRFTNQHVTFKNGKCNPPSLTKLSQKKKKKNSKSNLSKKMDNFLMLELTSCTKKLNKD